MRNDLYWQDRYVQLKERLLDKGVEHYHNVAKQYNLASLNVQKEINNFYQRFAENNQLDLLEAKKLLNAKELKEFKWTVQDYIDKGSTLNYSNEWVHQLENASLRYRISRLEALQLQMQQQVENVMGHEVDELDNMTRQIYEDGYYRSIFELQKGTGVGNSFAILDADKINKVISKPWASDGTNFSERVWGEHRPALIKSLNTDLVQALIRGDNPQDLTDKIAKEFNVAKYKANRLLYTEAAFFSEASQKDAFDEMGVKFFSICATLDNDTCEDCGDREGEKIPMSMYEVGVTAPPFHPNCRCTTLPEDGDDSLGERIARDENGKTYHVPNNMTYRQWKEEYVGGNQNLTKSENDDKINSKGDSMSLEYQRYGRNKDTLINNTYINSGEYRRKFDDITDDPKVNRVLYQKAKEMLKHRSGTMLEDMYWIDAMTGEVVASALNEKEPEKIFYTKGIKNALAGKTNLITMHTHPQSMPPSIADFNSNCMYNYRDSLVICHDGKIFSYSAEEIVSPVLYNMYIGEFIDLGYTDYEAQLQTLRKLEKSHQIKFKEVD